MSASVCSASFVSLLPSFSIQPLIKKSIIWPALVNKINHVHHYEVCTSQNDHLLPWTKKARIRVGKSHTHALKLSPGRFLPFAQCLHGRTIFNIFFTLDFQTLLNIIQPLHFKGCRTLQCCNCFWSAFRLGNLPASSIGSPARWCWPVAITTERSDG